MNEICYVAYSEIFQQKAQRIFQGCQVKVDTLVYSKEILDYLPKSGYRVLLGRGGTARKLRNKLQIPVVDIPISFDDIIGALLKASRYGNKIGIIGYGNFLNGLEALNPILSVEITQIIAEDAEDTRRKIAILRKQGVAVLIGGLLQTQIAEELGMHHVLLDINERALMAAYREAESIRSSMLFELRKKEEMAAILNSTQEGYIAIDRKAKITLVNTTAAKLLSLDKENMIGYPLQKNLPELAVLMEVLRSGKERLRETLRIGTTDILCDMLPFRMEDGQSVGAIAAFHDINTITKDEHAIRSKLYGNGLYATYTFDNVIHSSMEMDKLIWTAKKYAVRESAILIMGETGVGKEMFAQSIHNVSNRRKRPFVAINCASIPESILESELFGYEEGAFTGAKKNGKPGLFELAHKGTLFLDEIGEMPIRLQARLLRALQEKKVMRLGGCQVIPVDVRIISATNKPLFDLVEKKKFRADLFYRLNVLTLIVPPLRQRTEDLPILISAFMKKRGLQLQLTDDAIREITRYDWPGNARQLDNFIEKLCVTVDQKVANAQTILTLLRRYEPPAQRKREQSPQETGDKTVSRKEIQDALTINGGNKQKTARFLGIHRSTLWRLLKKYNI